MDAITKYYRDKIKEMGDTADYYTYDQPYPEEALANNELSPEQYIRLKRFEQKFRNLEHTGPNGLSWKFLRETIYWRSMELSYIRVSELYPEHIASIIDRLKIKASTSPWIKLLRTELEFRANNPDQA